MKRAFFLVLASILISISSGTVSSNEPSCPGLVIGYTGLNKRYSSESIGVFSVENKGATPVRFALARPWNRILHPRAAEIRWKGAGDEAWRTYRYVLEDALPPRYTLELGPGETQTIAVSSEIFGWGGRNPGGIYAVKFFSADFKCEYMSPEFLPSP
jgi:hypothetical protein